MRVSPITGDVSADTDELITGLWLFTHAQGFQTNVITEWLIGDGVTIDGLLIKDGGIPQGAVTAHQAALSLLFTQLTDSIADAQVPASAVIQHQAALAIAFAQLTSSIADAQVPASAVTQHQAALSLLFTQLTDSIAVGQVPVGAVTQHEAALAILESQIADGTIFARLGVSESILATWTFDVQTNIDALLAQRSLSAASDITQNSSVVGDSVARFSRKADGRMEWGDGSGAVDTNLRRTGVGELTTGDDFVVGGVLDLAGDIEMSGRDMTLSGAGTDDDVDTGTQTVQRLDPNSTNNISGLAGGRANRMIVIVNIVAEDLILQSQAVASVAANRMILPGGGNLTLGVNDAIWLWYDGTTSRWRGLAPNP